MRSVLILALFALPQVLRAQVEPPNVSVNLRVVEVTRSGDTTRIAYKVENAATSTVPLYHLTIAAPAPVVAISQPSPIDDWATNRSYRGISVAEWVVLGDEMQPGEVSPDLEYTAVGIPTITTFWARGYVPPAPLGPADTLPVVSPSDPLTDEAVTGKTVGVGPPPSDSSAAGLVSMLNDLLAQSCDMEWVASSTCEDLAAMADAAAAAAAAGTQGEVRTQLEALSSAVVAAHEATPTPGLNDAAFWLLRTDAEAVLGLLPTPALPVWTEWVPYAVGDEVSYGGLDYRCRQAHTSQPGWAPPQVYALWSRISAGDTWAPQVEYQAGDEVLYDGHSYRALQGHQSQPGWEPPNVPALWTLVG